MGGNIIVREVLASKNSRILERTEKAGFVYSFPDGEMG